MTGPNIPRRRGPSMVDAALGYLKRGWNVIPVRPDKKPYLPSWEEYQRRMATEEEIREWWDRWPAAGIAVLTGALSGIVVIDTEAGAATLATKTLTATTGGGGRHYYFKHPGGTAEVPCAVRFRPDTDCRGDGGYVVVPPSLHRSGVRYEWDDPKTRIADVPGAFLEQLRTKRKAPLVEKDWATDIPHGERDVELTRRAGRLLRAGMPAAEAFEVLKVVNAQHCKPPLGDEQVRKIVHSIAGREATRREGPKASGFTVLDQREMLRKYGEDEMRWAVDGWLPEASCGLLVAPPGNYKTWILQALGFSVATGRPFLGRYDVASRGPVLFIQQEDPWGMLQSRLASMFPQQVPAAGSGKDPEYELDCRFVRELDEILVYWYTDRRLNFADRAVLAGMEQKIQELKPRLVMIDPLYTAVDTRDYMAEGAQRMTALKLMRDAHGCSFIVAHHTTVSGSAGFERSSIWGSQFLNAWLEFGWRMPEGTDAGNVVVRHFKGASDPKRIRVKFRITDFSFEADVDEDYSQSVAERIEAMVEHDPGVTQAEIAAAVGVGRSTVQRVIGRMGRRAEEE